MKILTGGIEMARFTAADTQALFDIRNHESVRAFMADPAPLDFEAHCRWTRAHLLDGGDVLLFMIRAAGVPRGFSLLKRLTSGTAEIGLMVREAPRHGAVGAIAGAATIHCAFERLSYQALVSWVVPAHRRAFAFNESFGGMEVPSEKPGMVQYHVSREACLANANYRRLRTRLGARLAMPAG